MGCFEMKLLPKLVYFRNTNARLLKRGISVLDKFVKMVISIGSKGSLLEVSQAEGRSLPFRFRIEGGLQASRTMNN